MRNAKFLLCFLLAACAHSAAPPAPTPIPPAPPKAEAAPVVETPPLPSAPTLPQGLSGGQLEPSEEGESEVESSNLGRAISEWIASHEGADFDEAARAANRLLRKIGFPLALDVAQAIQPNEKSVQIRAGTKTFVFQSGKELAPRADYCGERYLRVPAHIIGQDRAALVSGGKSYPFSLTPFRREVFRVLRGKRVISTFFTPEPSEPIGVSGNGRTIYLRFPLEPEPTTDWWMRVARQQPALLDEEPYLVLRVSKQSLYFDENIEHIVPQEVEVDETTGKKTEIYRWRFLPTGFLLELSTRCGKSPRAESVLDR